VVQPCLRLHTPLIEPDMQISRIRLSDKTSRLHPRHVLPKSTQTYEPKVPVEVRGWIGPASASPDLVLGTQPPTQLHSCVAVERAIRFVDHGNAIVVGTAASSAVQLTDQLCGLLPSTRSVGQRMDFLDHALDAVLYADGASDDCRLSHCSRVFLALVVSVPILPGTAPSLFALPSSTGCHL
jgi:hypothetical protein